VNKTITTSDLPGSSRRMGQKQARMGGIAPRPLPEFYVALGRNKLPPGKVRFREQRNLPDKVEFRILFSQISEVAGK